MNVDFIRMKYFIDEKKNDVFRQNILYGIITGLFIVFIVMCFIFIKIPNYYEGIMYITKDEIYTYVEDTNLCSNNLIIDKKNYSSKVLEIVYDDYVQKYKCYLDIDFKNIYINNSTVLYGILLEKQTLFNYLRKNMQ